MQRDIRHPRLNLQRKLVLAHAAVTLAAVLTTELVVLGILALTPAQSLSSQSRWNLTVALTAIGAPLMGLLLGLWASHRIVRRLQRTFEISRAWLRGNLSLRIDDHTRDEIGLLAEQLDLLAEHLEQDEQDLDELRERNMRLTDQVRALAVVEERNRLARELHDSVKQHLFSLTMTASAIRTRFDTLKSTLGAIPPDLAEMVREIETAARTAQQETTRLIEDLRPGTLQEQGLASALNDYTLLFGAREHLLVYLEPLGNDKFLPPAAAEALYRVAQEALHNVARHARATRVDVQLRCTPSQTELTIRDNGIGFDARQPHRGLGVANMQERMMAIGGRLAIDSQISIGTTVMAEVGLPHLWSTSLDMPVEATTLQLCEQSPNPTIENWAWLGQKLVIPVGQTWPWLPADRLHLRRPLVEPGADPLIMVEETSLLGLMTDYVLHIQQQDGGRTLLVRLDSSRSGYEWETDGASWTLRRIRGSNGRIVLTRNGQPLAAMQYQGRLLNGWSEIIYDGRGYCLCYAEDKDRPEVRLLVDEIGDEWVSIQTSDSLQITLHRALPLPLLIMVAMRVVEEVELVSTTASGGTRDGETTP